MEYDIITKGGTGSLTHAVNDAMEDGWLPHGGPFTTQDKRSGSMVVNILFHQAVLRKKQYQPVYSSSM